MIIDELENEDFMSDIKCLFTYILVVLLNYYKPQLRPGQAKAKPKPWLVAWLEDFQSQSRDRPGQSPSFQAKPDRNITNWSPTIDGIFRLCCF